MRRMLLLGFLVAALGLAAWSWHRRAVEAEWTAGYRQATSLYWDGKTVEAAKRAQDLLWMSQRRWPDGRQTGLVLNLCGLIERTQGKQADAEATFTKAAEILKDDPGSLSIDFGKVQANLGSLYLDSGRPDRADAALQTALNVYRADPGAAMGDLGFVSLQLGQLRMAQGRYLDAASLLEQTLLVNQKYLAPNDPMRLRSAVALADTYRLTSRLADAQKLYQAVIPALEASNATSNNGNKPALDAWLRYAFVLSELGNNSEAAVFATKAAEAIRQIPASQGLERASQLSALADIYEHIHLLKEADAAVRQATATLESLAPRNHPALPSAYFVLGRISLDLGNVPTAQTYLRLALQGREELYGQGHSATANVAVWLAAVRLAQHREADARELAQKALPVLEKGEGGQSIDVARALEILGSAEKALNELPAAETFLSRAVDIRQQRQLPSHPAYLNALRNLQSVYLAEGKNQESASMRKQINAALASQTGQTVESKTSPD